MPEAPTLRSERLILRPWRLGDREPFAALNADPRVAATLGGPLDHAGSDALVDRIAAGFAEHGYGLWAVEVPGEAPFVGFIGLSVPGFDAPFMPAVEIGWRLAYEHWGRGYATEGARVVLDYAFTDAGLEAVVSFTAESNRRSRAVMERIGMHHNVADDFDHPKLGPRDPLRRHVLYRLRCDTWRSSRAGLPA